MLNKRCGNCKYIGTKNGDYLKMPNGEIQYYYFCENKKSMFDACIRTATGCLCWAMDREDGEQ